MKTVTRPKKHIVAIAAVAAALLVGLTACGGTSKPPLVPSATGADPVVTVTVVDNRYEPAEVEIEAGQAVRWVFQGAMEHDVVAEDGSFVSELLTSGEYVHVFEDAGEFPYDCSIHPEMTGRVTVR
jgi:plastocyanin